MEPKQGERGLWYVGTVGFGSKEAADEYIRNGFSTVPRQLPIQSLAPSHPDVRVAAIAISIVVTMLIAGWYLLDYRSVEKIAERKQTEVAKKCSDTTMAYVMSQNYAKRLLKAPGSADFPMITEVSSRAIGDCKFEILAYVDAQNSFGAKMRTGYSATMSFDPETDRWSADDLKIDR